jgi:hypothetical protein
MRDFQPGQLRILAVDDEESILEIYRQILSHEKTKDQEMFSEIGALTDKLFGETVRHPPSLAFDLVTCCQGNEAVDVVRTSLEENNPFAVAFIDVRIALNKLSNSWCCKICGTKIR